MPKDILDKIFEASVNDRKSVQEMSMKLCKESGKVAQAVLSCTNAPGCGYKNLTIDDAIEEAVDCIISSGALIARLSEDKVNRKKVDAIFRKKLKKWVEKSKRTIIRDGNLLRHYSPEELLGKYIRFADSSTGGKEKLAKITYVHRWYDGISHLDVQMACNPDWGNTVYPKSVTEILPRKPKPKPGKSIRDMA